MRIAQYELAYRMQMSIPEATELQSEPDYIFTLNEVQVPAESEDLFLKETLTFDVDESQWIRAIEFLPGDRRVTHHFQTTYNNGAGKSNQIGSEGAQEAGVLAIWTAMDFVHEALR